MYWTIANIDPACRDVICTCQSPRQPRRVTQDVRNRKFVTITKRENRTYRNWILQPVKKGNITQTLFHANLCEVSLTIIESATFFIKQTGLLCISFHSKKHWRQFKTCLFSYKRHIQHNLLPFQTIPRIIKSNGNFIVKYSSSPWEYEILVKNQVLN